MITYFSRRAVLIAGLASVVFAVAPRNGSAGAEAAPTGPLLVGAAVSLTAVSYIPLTLPTNRKVQVSVVASPLTKNDD